MYEYASWNAKQQLRLDEYKKILPCLSLTKEVLNSTYA